jgi:hypothetical protein
MKKDYIISHVEEIVNIAATVIHNKLMLHIVDFWSPSTKALLRLRLTDEINDIEEIIVQRLSTAKKVFCNTDGFIFVKKQGGYYNLLNTSKVSNPIDDNNTNLPLTEAMIVEIITKEFTKRIQGWSSVRESALAIETKSLIKYLFQNM